MIRFKLQITKGKKVQRDLVVKSRKDWRYHVFFPYSIAIYFTQSLNTLFAVPPRSRDSAHSLSLSEKYIFTFQNTNWGSRQMSLHFSIFFSNADANPDPHIFIQQLDHLSIEKYLEGL